MEALFQQLLHWMQVHPGWASFIIVLVSALESFLVVGLFVPGTVVMFGVGAMIAAGGLELWPTLAWAAFGAVLGDGSSYLIGRHYHQQLRVLWPFRRYPVMISRGVDFFHRHGGKSVLLARFVGPVRPLLPAVAGMLDMPPARFFAANSLSALLWAPAYILPGLLFGASLGLAAEIAGRLALLLLVLVALLWSSWWLVRRIARSFQPHAASVQLRILDWARQHPVIEPMAAALLDPEHPEARGMTVFSLLLLVASWALFAIPAHLEADNLLTNLDLYLYNALQALRTPPGDRLMVMITELGDPLVLYSFTGILCLWLLARRDWRMALHWVLTVLTVAALTWTLKQYTDVPRPPVVVPGSMSPSFPSLHASLSMAVFGFLAAAMARELRASWHWLPYSVATFLIAAIGFSRLYLGVHWLSDVLAGWSLGLIWVAAMGIAYRHHPAPPVPVARFTLLALVTFGLLGAVHINRALDADLGFYAPAEPAPLAMDREQWLDNGWRALPAFRDDLEGRHHHPFSLQYLGEPARLARALAARGWRAPAPADAARWLDLFTSDTPATALPVLPQLHRGRQQALLLLRPEAEKDRLLALRLWDSGYRDPGSGHTLWVGNVAHLGADARLRLMRFLRTENDFDQPLRELAHDLEGWQQRKVRRTLLPADSPLRWDGTTLLIWGGG